MTAREKHLSKSAWPALIALVALNAYLVSPLVVNELFSHLASGRADKLLLFSVPASLFWLFTLHVWVERPLRLHMALLPFYLAVGFDLYLLLHYRTRLSSSSISVMLDNQESAADYVVANALSIFLPLLLGSAIYLLGLVQLRGVRLAIPRAWRWGATIALTTVYLLVSAKQVRVHGGLSMGLLDVASHDLSSPLGVLPQSAVAYMVFRDTLAHERDARAFQFGARRTGANDARVVVLVIGESSRPDHWSLYGYARDTTPRLNARNDLLAFRDVTAEAALTKISVPLIITRADADDMHALKHEKSIVSAYREAGYRTAWLSTQQRDQWTGAINRYSKEAGYQRFFERRHDGVLVSELASWLVEPEQAGKPALVVLHTQGSHFVFADRYPEEFRQYPSVADERERMINTYDESIAYTDFVLDSLIKVLEQSGRPAAMMYVADHAENLRDDSRDLFGHFFGNDKDIPIPMLMWLSRDMVAADPDAVAAARSRLSARLSTSAAFHTLLDLGGVAIPADERTPVRSLLQPTFRERPRMIVTSTQKVVDYDQAYPAARK